jgi:hypothetical protein
MLRKIRMLCLACTVVLFVTAGNAPAGTRLDENEEVRWIMGDLSALRTAVQMYYTEHGDSRVPPLSSVLEYFEPGSLPPGAASLYALKEDDRGWYAGFKAAELKDETYALLEGDAQALGLLGDDLRTPWRRGSRHFWTQALNFSATAGNTILIKKDNDTLAAALVFATLVGIVADRQDRYCYYIPGYDGYWRSALMYRPSYFARFFERHSRPFPRPRLKNGRRGFPAIAQRPPRPERENRPPSVQSPSRPQPRPQPQNPRPESRPKNGERPPNGR